MLDIDALLAQQEEIEIKIKLEDDELPDLPVLIMKIPPKDKQRKLYNQYYRPVMPIGRKRGASEIEMKADDIGYAIALCEFVTGWEGVKQDFDRKKLIAFLKKVERVARAFARGAKDIFDQIESDAVERAKVAEKN